jgi:predicted  nucleic acid-binding Zn-ribbon protein
MEISLIYVLIIAEVMFVLLGLSITFFILWFRKPKPVEVEPAPVEDAESELDAIDLGSSYLDYLDQAIERNSTKLQQTDSNGDADEENNESEEEESTESAASPTEEQVELLQAREQFLLVEKEAAEQVDHEINFWDHVYSGMQNLVEQFKTTEVITEVSTETETIVDEKVERKETVVYIETQGKKIDGEVNKLKDIISEQENALSSLKKSLDSAETDAPENSPALEAIREQLEVLERQLSDSKMCMEVLEMENYRLQEEVDKMGERHGALFEDGDDEKDDSEDSTSMIDLDQMKEVMAEQEAKINQLLETIDSLEIEASQADKLKETLSGFTRTSKEMMSCITILEEENERLQEVASHVTDEQPEEAAPAISSDEETAELQSKVSGLEEEIIKKDVAFAQLQDEFSSMEAEYLSMYEAMHNSEGQE